MKLSPTRIFFYSLAATAAMAVVPALASAAVKVDTVENTIGLRGGGQDERVNVIYDMGTNKYIFAGQGGTTLQSQTPVCVESMGGTVVTCSGAGVTNFAFVLGNGNDTLTFDASWGFLPSFIHGQGGVDSVSSDPGADGREFFTGGRGPDTFNGGASIDTFSYDDHKDGVRARIGGASSGNSTDGPAGARDKIGSAVENLWGGQGNDKLIGNELGNVLRGFAGNDRLVGRTGADRLFGMKGIDKLFARDGIRDRKLNCGPGANRLEKAKRDPVDPRAKSC